MPNHVSSNLTITGPAADVRAFVTAVDFSKRTKSEFSDDDESKTFDVNGVVPMPLELLKNSSPVAIQTQEEINKLWAEWESRKAAGELKDFELKLGKPFQLGITKEVSEGLIAKYGHDGWYGWALANWGTKWGIYDSGEWDITEHDGNATAKIYYNTAWSPANEFFITASNKFPTLNFDTEYADEGGGFVAETSFHNGEMYDMEHGWDDADGCRIRKSVGCWNYDGDDEFDQNEEEFATTDKVV